MPPRANEPPRRGPDPRRGGARAVEPAAPDDGDGSGDGRGRAFDGIGDARAYTPRGRTVRDNGDRGRPPRTGRAGDPFRPVLQVLDGGQSGTRDRRRPGEEPPAGPTTGSGSERAGAERPDRTTPPRRTAATRRTSPTEQTDRSDGPAEPARRRRPPPAEPEPRGRRQVAGARTPTGRTPTGRTSTGRTATPSGRTTAGGSRLRDTAAGRADTTRRDRADAADQDRSERTASRPAAPAPRRGPTGPGERPTAAGRPTGPPRRPGGPPGRLVAAQPPPLADTRRRLRLGSVLALSLFVAIGIRLVSLQVFESPAYAQSLLKQRQSRLATVVLPAPRGSILDRDGAVLAHSIEARHIYADPTMIKDPGKVAAALSPELGIARSRLMQLIAKRTRTGGGESQFEYVARGVDVAVADRISAMKLDGIGQGRDERREVPGVDLAANLIGFTGQDVNGLEGLEARYDDVLRGRDGKRVFTRGNPYAGKGELAKEIPGGYNHTEPAKPGTTLQLTIERDLQYEFQRILGVELRKVDATIGAALIIDVHTGEVLAQASYPPYDPAKPSQVKPADREDVATSVVADPGSTHKAFIFGAALEEGIIRPDSVLKVGPALRRGGYPFKDSHPHPKNTLVTMPGLLAYSSNVGTILLADKLTPEKVYEYQQKFGLGSATDEGMPGEATGRLLPPSEWSPSGSGSIPLGHSVDATLIQMAAGYAAIANDGTYIQPHLIKATIAADGTATPSVAPRTHRVLSPANAAALRTMMEAVVQVPGATGNLAQVTGYRVAGKTGTGKRLVNGRYTRYEAGSFIGMAPADNPRYVVAVFADTPHGGGGTVAGPAFSKMMKLALAHYRVPPSGAKAPTFTICPQAACW